MVSPAVLQQGSITRMLTSYKQQEVLTNHPRLVQQTVCHFFQRSMEAVPLYLRQMLVERLFFSKQHAAFNRDVAK